jgi:hypothetical protein
MYIMLHNYYFFNIPPYIFDISFIILLPISVIKYWFTLRFHRLIMLICRVKYKKNYFSLNQRIIFNINTLHQNIWNVFVYIINTHSFKYRFSVNYLYLEKQLISNYTKYSEFYGILLFKGNIIHITHSFIIVTSCFTTNIVWMNNLYSFLCIVWWTNWLFLK